MGLVLIIPNIMTLSTAPVFNTQLIEGLVTTILALSPEEQELLLDQLAEARTKREIEQNLAAYEQQYGMTSEVFHARFLTGALGDSEDYMEWAGFYEMLHSA